MTDEPQGVPDLETLEKEVEVEFYRSGGPGGQHRNKVETGVRMKHLPTGIVVTATERRSQSRNRQLALERLQRKLRALRRKKKKRVPTRPSAAALARAREEKEARSRKKRDRRQPDPDE
jgi:protein subunit release factor B